MGKEEKGMVEVAAALIRKDDTVLICQRPEQKARGLLWEFAGSRKEFSVRWFINIRTLPFDCLFIMPELQRERRSFWSTRI